MGRSIVWGIDGTNRVHCLWHATHAVQQVVDLFRRDLAGLRSNCKPAVLAVAFDSPTCFRRQLDPTYKAHRDTKPDELRRALELAADAVCDLGLSYLCVDGFEADDCLASLAALSVQRETPCVLLSPDKDLRQCLVAGKVSIRLKWAPWSASNGTWITAATLEEKTGLRPDQWIDYQCLVGDSTDGIRGADGIGPVTAVSWLKSSTIDKLLTNHWVVKMSEKQYQALRELGTRLNVVRQLVTLRTDLPCVVDCFGPIDAVEGAAT